MQQKDVKLCTCEIQQRHRWDSLSIRYGVESVLPLVESLLIYAFLCYRFFTGSRAYITNRHQGRTEP